MSGKNIKPNLPSTEIKTLPPLDNPNEEIRLDFIGPMTENNRRLYILLSMDRGTVNGQRQVFTLQRTAKRQ